ncbi:hypothetical protein [Aliikangiella sp. IMCC44359]|uniref:hypothetical protein n=1 Tax=Aliikangiella sp. IMCC44359 TaxID=3459125 RepID=UPI00403A9CDA
MRKISLYIMLVFSAYYSSLIFASSSEPSVYVQCNTCYNSQDFQQAAIQHMSTAPTGSFDLAVINTANYEIWFVSVNVVNTGPFGSMGGAQVNIVSAMRAPQAGIDEFKQLDEMMKVTPVVDFREIDTSIGIEICSAGAGACATLSTFLRQLPLTQAYTSASWMTRAWRSIRGNKELKYLVIFEDGSMEVWKLEGSTSTAAAFYPIEGSAVNPNAVPTNIALASSMYGNGNEISSGRSVLLGSGTHAGGCRSYLVSVQDGTIVSSISSNVCW